MVDKILFVMPQYKNSRGPAVKIEKHIQFRAVHEVTRWRRASHETFANALGRKRGAVALFDHLTKVIDYAKHGEPKFVIVWDDRVEGSGKIVKPDHGRSDGLQHATITDKAISRFEGKEIPSDQELEALFVADNTIRIRAVAASTEPEIDQLVEAAGAEEHAQVKIDERILAAIMTRRGQPEFRAKLLAAYDSRCAITGCNAIEALEAAHIIPFSEDQNYALSNGILMRADIHTLFDLFLMSIDPRTSILRMAPGLHSAYGELDGRRVTPPENQDAQPDPERLGKHFEQWVLRWAPGRT